MYDQMANQVPPAYTTTQTIPTMTSTMTTPRFDNAHQKRKYLTGMRVTAIMHLIGGTLLVLLGIVAIILLAFWSYFATPIWAGIVIYVVTGLLGLCASSRGNRCSTAAYVIMSVIALLMSISLTVMYSLAAAFEDGYYYYYYDSICQPGGYWTEIFNCAKSEAARETFDALIAITAFFELIVCLVSASYGCCLACACCESCCKSCCGDSCNCCLPPPPPTTAVFMNNGSVVPTAGPGLHQGGNILVQGGMPYPGQPAVYIVQQGPTAANPNGAPLQYGSGTAPSYAYVNPALQQPVPNQHVTVALPPVSATAPQHAQPNVYASPPQAQAMSAYPSYSHGLPEVEETKK